MTFDHYTIRPVRNEDAINYHSFIQQNKERIAPYFPGTITDNKSLEASKLHIAERVVKAEKGEYFTFVITDQSTDQIIGAIHLKDIDKNTGKCEFGFFIDSAYGNKKIMSKSLVCMIDYCFDTLKLNKLFMRIAEDNTASRRVAEKNNFVVEGILRSDFKTYEGKLVNLVYYGLLKSDIS